MITRLDIRSGVPLYLQIADAMRDAILSGRARPGEKVATVREMAARLRVNPGTVAAAYDELSREGLLACRIGAGTFIAADAAAAKGQKQAARERLKRHVAAVASAATAAGLSGQELHRLIDRALKDIALDSRVARKAAS